MKTFTLEAKKGKSATLIVRCIPANSGNMREGESDKRRGTGRGNGREGGEIITFERLKKRYEIQNFKRSAQVFIRCSNSCIRITILS